MTLPMNAAHYYGRITAPEAERAMLESLGIEVAPRRSADSEAFYVRMDAAAHARLAELATDFPHVVHARAPDVAGPLTVVTMGPAEWAAELDFVDFVAARPGPMPAWLDLQRAALAHEAAASTPALTDAQVAQVLAAQGEDASPAQISRYASLDALAAKVRSGKHWARGEIFTCALDAERFVVMKQIAPSSCEMLTLTHRGFHDVITAHRYAQQALVAQLREYLQAGPELGLCFEQAPGFALGGYVVGHQATLPQTPEVATIVGLRSGDGQTRVTLQFARPQPGPDGSAPNRFAERSGDALSATWAPGAGAGVLPDAPPYGDGILLLHGTELEFTDAAGQRRSGRVANKYTVADRAAARPITLRTGAFDPRRPEANLATVAEGAITRLVQLSGWAADYARTWPEAAVARAASKRFRAHWDASFTRPGERVVDGADFGAAAGYSVADRRAIAALQVGQRWDCPEHGPAHYVVRLPDQGPSPEPGRARAAWAALGDLDGPGSTDLSARAPAPASAAVTAAASVGEPDVSAGVSRSVMAATRAVAAHREALGLTGDAATQVWHLLASLHEYCAVHGVKLDEELAEVRRQAASGELSLPLSRARARLPQAGPELDC